MSAPEVPQDQGFDDMKRICRIALLGECMIELRGQMFGMMQQAFGGDTLNTAVYLARLATHKGVQVSYATDLGIDPFSDAMVKAWEAEGIDTSLVKREQGRMPGLYTIQVDETGERTFHYWRDMSAAKAYFNSAVSPLEEQIEDIDALYFSGISLAILDATARDRLFSVAEQVRARGGKVIYDNNYRPRLWPVTVEARAWYAHAYEMADIVMITLDDEMALFGITDEKKALERAFSLPCPEVVVKRGADPAVVRITGSEPVYVPSFKVDNVVDTTAAGDSFAAGYLAARLTGKNPEESVRCGSRMASIVIQYPGAIIPSEAMPADLL